MTVPPGPNDLTTVAAVQAWLSVSAAQDNDLIQTLVTSASALIVTYTGRSFQSESYTEIRDGNGRDSMVLFNRPVSAVASVTVNAQSIPETSGWPVPGYSFNDELLMLAGYSFPRGRGNVTVVYTSGFVTIPAEVAQACIELVAFKYALKDKAGLVSEGALQQMTSYSQKDMPSGVQTALNLYRRRF